MNQSLGREGGFCNSKQKSDCSNFHRQEKQTNKHNATQAGDICLTNDGERGPASSPSPGRPRDGLSVLHSDSSALHLSSTTRLCIECILFTSPVSWRSDPTGGSIVEKGALSSRNVSCHVFVHSDQTLCSCEYFKVLRMVRPSALLCRALLHQLWCNISLLLCQRLRRQDVTFHTLPLSLPDWDDRCLKSKAER